MGSYSTLLVMDINPTAFRSHKMYYPLRDMPLLPCTNCTFLFIVKFPGTLKVL